MKKRLFIIIPIIVVMTIIIVLLLNNNDNKKIESKKDTLQKEYMLKLKNDLDTSGYVISIIPNNIVKAEQQRNFKCENSGEECDVLTFKITGTKKGSTYVRFIKGQSFDNINAENTITYRVDVDKNLNIKVTKSQFIDETHSFDEEFIQ